MAKWTRTGKTIRILAAACWFVVPITLVLGADSPGDVQFERQGDQSQIQTFPPAWFPHWVHRIRYRCDACHESLFRMQAGANNVTMAMFKEGKACGACHNGGPAFDDGFEHCSRCHRTSAEQ